jgi:hypothetical protein
MARVRLNSGRWTPDLLTAHSGCYPPRISIANGRFCLLAPESGLAGFFPWRTFLKSDPDGNAPAVLLTVQNRDGDQRLNQLVPLVSLLLRSMVIAP